MGSLTTPRALRTRERILDAALDLFERQGYEETTTSEIICPTGDHPDDLLPALPDEGVSTGRRSLRPDDRGGRRRYASRPAALREGPGAACWPPSPAFRRPRTPALDADLPSSPPVPSLRGAIAASTQATQDAIVNHLRAQGVDRFAATVASAACLGAVTAALLAWGRAAPRACPLADVVRLALTELAPGSVQ